MNLKPGFMASKTLCSSTLLMLAVSCGEGVRTTSFVDEGQVCISSTEQGAVVVRVAFPTCLSSSCDTLQDASCTLEVSGDELRVSSQGVVESKGKVCTLDCRAATVECAIATLEPGDYTVIHGAQRETVSIPNVEGVIIGDPSPVIDWCGSK
jgi:hypothetical protein